MTAMERTHDTNRANGKIPYARLAASSFIGLMALSGVNSPVALCASFITAGGLTLALHSFFHAPRLATKAIIVGSTGLVLLHGITKTQNDDFEKAEDFHRRAFVVHHDKNYRAEGSSSVFSFEKKIVNPWHWDLDTKRMTFTLNAVSIQPNYLETAEQTSVQINNQFVEAKSEMARYIPDSQNTARSGFSYLRTSFNPHP